MISSLFIINYGKKGDIAYILMVDVDYPVYLQLLHRDSSSSNGKKEISG